jgi:hypothetical protein
MLNGKVLITIFDWFGTIVWCFCRFQHLCSKMFFSLPIAITHVRLHASFCPFYKMYHKIRGLRLASQSRSVSEISLINSADLFSINSFIP